MFEEVLPAGTKSTLALLEKNQTIQNSYLAGGTGLALQLATEYYATLDLSGALRLGPDEEYMAVKEQD